MERITAVHFGPGRLGLGLVVATFLDSESYDVFSIGRPGAEIAERRTYFLRFPNPEFGTREHQVEWAGNPVDASEAPPELRVRLSADKPVVFSAALGAEGVTEAEGRIATFLALRPRSAETVFLACENEGYEMYERLSDSFPQVAMRRCVVDRICAWDEHPTSFPGKQILAHDVCQWVIPSGAGLECLSPLLACDHVVLNPGPADGERARKLAVVNGIHLVMATISRREGIDRLPLTGEIQAAFRDAAMPLARSMLQATQAKHGLEVDESFAQERIRAFCEMPDSTTRILSGRYLRHDLRSYVQRLNSRISDSARDASAAGLDLKPYLWAFEEVARSIQERDSFLDVSVTNLETGLLDTDPNRELPIVDEVIDHEVADIWRIALDWAPVAEAERLTRTVESALAVWHS